ncbi:conjugal transfer protein TraF [Pseudoalteromonas sp. Angola-7]|jgi:conjugal transfer pilus assembly protein TraF|uniref:conjugal transfer protein TraF n=1 Tax=Pseudoalteromonas sp. Angola-7 TaxID=3025336 RepID=UPI002359D92B|nr:conjugal transfer protein TraF [Pseudoalteromonas sp. Angola-7]MDC9530209.1 conjugal transfer protein TraF [Pseudoalteromonas sp. Angola-7]
MCFHASAEPTFYGDKFRGWYWFEEPPTEPEEKPQEEKPPTPTQQKTEDEKKGDKIRLDVAWLRSKIPEYQEAAINNPTRENLARYLYTQRYMLDISSRFATKATEFNQFESELDETKRRPMSSFSLNVFKEETKRSISQVLDSINEKTHIWFFFSSNCAYCKQQLPLLKELNIRFGVNILAISMDGSVLPGMDDMEVVVDKTNVAERFGVTFTPTMFMALNDGSGFTKIGEGLTTLPLMQDRILLSARLKNVITDEQYQLTQNVREINVLTDTDGTMLADAELIENDPGYLAEILKSKLADSKPVGAQLFNSLSGE